MNSEAVVHRSAETELNIKSLQTFVYRWPIEVPVVTSFGVMHDRPMVLVRVEDYSGAVGWGEIWCNFPAIGAEYRARVVERILAPLLAENSFAQPYEAFRFLSNHTDVLAIQAGEPGPISQAIAGIDIALWDLAARKAGVPLWHKLGGANRSVPVYASGINPTGPERLAAAKRAEGYTAFKLKVGFGLERDVTNLDALRRELGADAILMADANQAWSIQDASRAVAQLEDFSLAWLEEPLRADRPLTEWCDLAAQTRIPLAAGENVSGTANFNALISANAVAVVQPDIAKWGGFSGCAEVARAASAAGLMYCPHWLGGGVGLLASAHLLAAVGGCGRLEIDANDNALRTLTCGALNQIDDGCATLSDEPGLGPLPDLEVLRNFLVPH